MMSGLLLRMRRVARRWGREFVEPEIRTHVEEIAPFVAREAVDRGPRLNLLLPSINTQHYFGGIHTAVVLYRELCKHFPRSRIVLVDSPPEASELGRFPDHVLAPCAVDHVAQRQVTPFCDRHGCTLPVGAQDYWLATAWWTAYAAQRLQQWQATAHGAPHPIAYLIQDFEPGFYPWSSRSALALATYRPTRDFAIFNTGLLADYFVQQGLGYERAWSFEPTLNDGLRNRFREVSQREKTTRERRIVVYGRPSTHRNCFELICEALRCWGLSQERASEWEIVAPGEIQVSIDLGPVRMRALGKLQIEDYADLLATSAVGLSLMVSPHPSYPPLEMAAFGMRVVTNRFANKDLGTFSPNIHSVPDLTPDGIAAALGACCAEFEQVGRESMPPFGMDHPFLSAGGFESIAAQLVEEWR
jgi:O-antigen biosynthesis protein